MTTAHETDLQGTCDDLLRRLDSLARASANKDGTIRRLNALLVLREAECARLMMAVERLTAECAELRAGVIAPPY